MANGFKKYIKKNNNTLDNSFGELLENHDKEAVSQRREVIAKIVELANNAENWKEASQEFYKLIEDFKSILCSDKNELESLNSELSAARKLFFEKRNEFFEKAGERFKENAILKKEVLAKLENVHYTSETIKDTDSEVKALSDEFFSIRFAGKDENDAIFNRFNELKNNLREERKNVLGSLQEGFEEKRIQKKAIIEKLAALVNNENWKNATEEFNNLCEEFKKIGFSGKEENDAISEAYKNAKNTFFTARQKFFDEVKAGNEVNIAKRKELIEEVKALYVNESWKEASAKVKTISDEFFKIGFCGKEANEALIEEFKEVRDGFYALRQEYFDTVNAARNTKQLEFLGNLASNKEAFIAKLREFIKNDNQRLEDFKGRLLSVRPGENAEETLERYQNIITDIKTRINNNKTKLKEVQDELYDVNKQIKEIKDNQ